MVGDTMCECPGVARTEVVDGSGVVQPGWLDGLICADGSLRAEPPPMHAMCLRLMLLVAAC